MGRSTVRLERDFVAEELVAENRRLRRDLGVANDLLAVQGARICSAIRLTAVKDARIREAEARGATLEAQVLELAALVKKESPATSRTPSGRARFGDRR